MGKVCMLGALQLPPPARHWAYELNQKSVGFIQSVHTILENFIA